MKVCSKCKEDKELSECYKDKSKKGGHISNCKCCRKKYRDDNKDKMKEYFLNNKEKLKEYNKKYHTENKEKNNERCKNYYENNKDKTKEN